MAPAGAGAAADAADAADAARTGFATNDCTVLQKRVEKSAKTDSTKPHASTDTHVSRRVGGHEGQAQESPLGLIFGPTRGTKWLPRKTTEVNPG